MLNSEITIAIERTIGKVITAVLLDNNVKRATKYLSPSLTIKATRRFRAEKLAKSYDLVFTIGRPNYEERAFIRDAKKAGESFPIKKIQFKMEKKIKK